MIIVIFSAKNQSIHPSVRPSIHPSIHHSIHLVWPPPKWTPAATSSFPACFPAWLSAPVDRKSTSSCGEKDGRWRRSATWRPASGSETVGSEATEWTGHCRRPSRRSLFLADLVSWARSESVREWGLFWNETFWLQFWVSWIWMFQMWV